MPQTILTITTASVAFVTTNIDDILLLMLFFAQVNASFRKRHIIGGHYIGFLAIVLISLLGFAGALILPPHLVGFLGIIPIGIGLYQLIRKQANHDDQEQAAAVAAAPPAGWFGGLLSAHTLNVAGVTLANGADNVSVYVPLFATQRPLDVALTIAVFLLLVGLWCFIGYRLIRYPAIARLLERYGERLVPYVFILLGLYILLEGLR